MDAVIVATDRPVKPDLANMQPDFSMQSNARLAEWLRPARELPASTSKAPDYDDKTTDLIERSVLPPSPGKLLSREVRSDTTPIEIWEGVVQDLNAEKTSMSVILEAKLGKMPRHAAEISLEWVSEQDKDLVRPGAVFYLTLYKQTTRGTVRNSQELRFRRLPSWAPSQIRDIRSAAIKLKTKLKSLQIDE